MEIDSTSFGHITIDGKEYQYDVVLYPSGVERRDKWITKREHGTSHKFTREELEEYLENAGSKEINVLYVGTGQQGKLGLLKEAKDLLDEKNIELAEYRTPKAAEKYNEDDRDRNKKLGIFHVTC